MELKIGATYRHVKRGTTYELLGRAKMQVAWTTLDRESPERAKNTAEQLEKMSYIVYVSTDDTSSIWVRPETEFCDGRFEGVG